MREGRRQVRRHDTGNQECQPDEAEAMQDEQRPQRFSALLEAEFRPDISSGHSPPRDEAECDTHEKPNHLLWHDELLLLEFQPLTATGGGDWGPPVAGRRGVKGIGDCVFAPPNLRIRRELRLRWEGTAEFAVVAIEIETRAERGDHELHELAKPVAKSPLVAGQRRIPTSDRLEVLWGLARHIEHVRGWRPQLEGTALVIVDIVANATELIDRVAGHPCGLHEQPGRGWHDLD